VLTPLSESIEADANRILDASLCTNLAVGEVRACVSFAVRVDVASKSKQVSTLTHFDNISFCSQFCGAFLMPFLRFLGFFGFVLVDEALRLVQHADRNGNMELLRRWTKVRLALVTFERSRINWLDLIVR
jgi:hypothetical protein